MQHNYYLKSRKEQNQIQIKIGVVALFFNLIVLALSILSGLHLLLLISITITLSIIAPFLDTPKLKKNGKLIYYSTLFIAEKEKNGKIIIHGGSLFDYVFVINKNLNGTQRTKFILQKYLEGILNLMETCEKNNNTSVKIKGTSYILNERTANKLGLKIIKTDYIQKLILTYNYVNIVISNSIAKRKISFPKISNIRTFESELNELIERKEFIQELNNQLKKSIANS
ncbi:hypothetical protein [uncultured Flavobacterium sp.]|uniref:hypothetical protein n=1 Tax=uncultured Flavobacterium sp. TaxID=165435 RepID=UPI0030EDA5C7|tara:strand:- start:1059 stop:1739 length:681 start_codon:yes stop_codon:yes gene_type:complete